MTASRLLWATVNFCPLKRVKRNMKNIPVKTGFSVKNLFGTIFVPKMVASYNSECNLSMRASVHLWKFVSSSQGYQKYSGRFFYIYRKTSWKNVIVKPSIPWKLLNLLEPYYMVLRLYSVIVPSPHVITTPVEGFYAVFTIVLVGMHLLSWTF